MARRGDLSAALELALKSATIEDSDQAAVELARKYAAVIDNNGDMLNVVGRAYRETLVELGMTPKARAALLKGEPPKNPAADPIDELRARREKRAAR